VKGLGCPQGTALHFRGPVRTGHRHLGAGNVTVGLQSRLQAALLSLAASVALSHNDQGQNNNDQGQNYHGGRPLRAPEIDPAQALGALTLLGGTIAIVRGYRRKK